MTGDVTWRRFTVWSALLTGGALSIGLALSYASAYRAAFHAGYEKPWFTAFGISVRPAHLFPLTLDVPLLVGYAGTIALAGRRSRVWATLVLAACSAATIALQVADGAGLVADHKWVRAVIHGWPPALAVLTAHLFVLMLQALGFLVPPAAEPTRPSWIARSWRWVIRTRKDIQAASDKDQDTGQPDAPQETPGLDSPPDMETPGQGQASTEDTSGVVDMTTRKPSLESLLPKVRTGELTQAKAARLAGVSAKTVQRHLNPAKTKAAQ